MATIPSEMNEAAIASQETKGGTQTERPKRATTPFWLQALESIASLKLTVTLFVLSIVLVYIGTVAQAEKDMWEVIRDYFRCRIAWVDFRVLFPQSFFPNMPRIPGGFYFPGGATIGVLLAVNLVAAHLIRFKVQARGLRLLSGVTAVAFGVLVTWLVIDSGHNKDGIQGLPMIGWDMLWNIIQLSLVGSFVATLIGYFRLDSSRKIERASLLTLAVAIGGLVGFLIVKGEDAALSHSSLRILWQLIQAEIAALLLLGGCILVFKRRGGIVVIHLGVGLLMFYELLVALTAVEEQIMIKEGDTVNFARDIRQTELVFENATTPNVVDFVAIPEEMLWSQETIVNDDLPFAITPLDYYRNSTLSSKPKPGEKNLATAGTGTSVVANEIRPYGGADGGKSNLAAAYVRIAPKDDPDSGDVYMFSQFHGDGALFPAQRKDSPEEIVAADGTKYHVSLRYRRNYKPYAVKLDNVVRENYEGTPTPRDYASYIAIIKDGQEPIEDKVWMNNPLRYAGETFYQSGYTQDRFGEWTTLQVVTNMGWMVPYVACMIVATGMLGHFGGTLTRFLNRYYKKEAAAATVDESDAVGKKQKRKRAADAAQDSESLGTAWGPTIAVVGLAAFVLLSGFVRPKRDVNGIRLEEFGKLPAWNAGRAMPISTVARTALATISNKTTIKYEPSEDEKVQRISATQWLLEMAIQTDRVDNYPVFRIENLDVQAIFGLERRQGLRYSYNELKKELELGPGKGKFDAAYRQAVELSQNDETALSPKQRKLLELASRIREYRRIKYAFQPMPFPDYFTQEQLAANSDKMEQIRSTIMQIPEFTRQAMEFGCPRLVMREPPKRENDEVPAELSALEEQIVPYGVAVTQAYPLRILMNQSPPEPLREFAALLDAYEQGDADGFQEHTKAYAALVAQHAPEKITQVSGQIGMEALLNKAQPFQIARWLYLLGFLMTCLGWLVARRVMTRAAFWLLLLVFAVHTIAYIVRMYASGRPPVTNLYSSALFIAWGCVGLGLIFESLYRISIGNLVAGICGFLSLTIAHYLETMGGDTMPVMQAVLDTQFWLTTHVVCVSVGYLATFVAGFLGVAYVAIRLLSPDTLATQGKEITRMIYGTVCFAAFFSLVGTVLGGLWADDSWGRFWGWDPKENGALIIVLWNAVILHARWGAMVKDRGLAVLAVIGNICTSWSWFGVNELGLGLHSYGFTEGVKMGLGIFWILNVIVIGAAFLPPLKAPTSPKSVRYSG